MSSVSSILGRVDGRLPSAVQYPAFCGSGGLRHRDRAPTSGAPGRSAKVAMIPKEPSDAARSGDFPQFPGEEVYSHAAALYQEKAEASLASLASRPVVAAAQGLPKATCR